MFCEGWRGLTMSELQAPFWIYGKGTLRLRFSSPEPTHALLWTDGVDRPLAVTTQATATVELRGRRWHWVMPEVQGLFPGRPVAGGLHLDAIAFSGWSS